MAAVHTVEIFYFQPGGKDGGGQDLPSLPLGIRPLHLPAWTLDP